MMLTGADPCFRGSGQRNVQDLEIAITRTLVSFLALLCLSVIAAPASHATGLVPDDLLPVSCAEGWTREGNVKHFTKDTLYEHINGEAELFFPFGFRSLATAAYVRGPDPSIALIVDIYHMDSVLGAFGIYSSYRNRDDTVVQVGAEGSLNPAQLLFYQDRFFMRLSASGTSQLGGKTLVACGKSLSGRLPGPPAAPKELGLLPAHGVLTGTEKYSATSLFGYPFFRAGLTAEVSIGGKPAKAFVVMEDSPEAARKALDRYDTYLKQSGSASGLNRTGDSEALSAADPLYTQVLILQKGSLLLGLARLADTTGGLTFLRDWAAQVRAL